MRSNNETNKYLLGFKVYSDLIKSVVANGRILPVSVGIFGRWGRWIFDEEYRKTCTIQ
jgi:hypothetical protein